MTSKLQRSVAAIGTLAAVALAAPAMAGDQYPPRMQQGHPGMMMGGGGMGMMGPGRGMMGPEMMGPGMMNGMGMGMATMHALDLDREQVRKMTQIHKKLAQQHAGMQAELQELQWELSRELAGERPSPEKVGELYEQMAQKRKAMIQERVRARNEMQEALTEEQRQRFREMMENRRQMHMGRGSGYDMDSDED